MQCLVCRRDMPAASRFCPSCGSPTVGSDVTTFTVPEQDRRSTADAIDHARFIPGSMLADRYRIVAFLGRGGMGEVYRAEDLKLGQPVALKFLPADVEGQSDKLVRFHQEVRLAREVSHPYVCRIYDIGEAEGRHFLSMEYVDGEDLASLLRRIGRLLPEKALELARQLSAGLTAAHDRGVLHGDLKPANVLIDGRGRVRIADFGLAGLIDEWRAPHVIAGTPAYMAPEQFGGHGISTRTDVYALGLLLYEMFTGKQAVLLAAGTGPLESLADQLPPASPSSLIPGFDPVVERVILWCLEKDPARRPPSALAVAAALPGGDPLAAALAAGETPSPDMVAAAGEVGSLAPAVGLVCLAAILIGLIPIVWMSRQTTLTGFVTMDKGPEVLAERARTIARNLGYTDRPADEAFGYESAVEYLHYIAEHDRSSTRWQVLRIGQPAALSFWYRRSPHALVPATSKIETIGEVTRQQPPPTEPGMVSVLMDTSGRLTGLTAAPLPSDEPATDARHPDWTALFAEAGLPIEAFSPARSTRIPSVYADALAAWDGVYPDRPESPIRVEAAAARGRPVHFGIVAPWTPPQQLEPTRPLNTAGHAGFVFAASAGVLMLSVLLLGGTALLARRNLRLGRGDRRGAFRLSLFGSTALLFGALRAHHVANLAAEQGLFVMLLSEAAFGAIFIWTIYIALEPHVRRLWPEMTIGWSRLIAGRVRDPLVGRDILIGALAGIVLTIVLQFGWVSPTWFGLPPPLPARASAAGSASSSLSNLLLGGRHAVSELVSWLGLAVGLCVWFLLILLFLNVLLRRRQFAAAAMILILTVSPSPWWPRGGNSTFDLVAAGLWAASFVFVLTRFGLLAAMVSLFVFQLTSLVPLMFDPSAPYISSSYLAVGTVLALAVYGFHTSLAGRPVMAADLLPNNPARP
jgi:predicted Ser/Thr protein kinase